jgi:hypothetical protein
VAETQKTGSRCGRVIEFRGRAQSIHGTYVMLGEAKMAEEKETRADLPVGVVSDFIGPLHWVMLCRSSEGEIFAYRLSILEQVKSESSAGKVCLMAAVQGRNDVHF